MSEDEARRYEDTLSQSKIFKRHNHTLHEKLTNFAKGVFKNESSTERECLSIFINESDQEDVKDFIVNRNPELGLNVVHPKSSRHEDDEMTPEVQDEIVKIYVQGLKEKVKSVRQLPFTNLNPFFHHTMGVITFCTRHLKFKHATGQFEFILDIEKD